VILIAAEGIPLWGMIMAGVGEAASGIAILDWIKGLLFRRLRTPWVMSLLVWETPEGKGNGVWDNSASIPIGNSTISVEIRSCDKQIDFDTYHPRFEVRSSESIWGFIAFRIQRLVYGESLIYRRPQALLKHLNLFIQGLFSPTKRSKLLAGQPYPIMITTLSASGTIVPEGTRVEILRSERQTWLLSYTLPEVATTSRCRVLGGSESYIHFDIQLSASWVGQSSTSKVPSSWRGRFGFIAKSGEHLYEVWRNIEIQPRYSK
jgi:hypothetical protein